MVGVGNPAFTVSLKKVIPVSYLMNSTSIALGEAYMDGNLDVEGNLYEALDHFLGQMGKFQTDESYSCGYFKTPEDSLHDAQKNKVQHILEKLYLEEGMTLLDIGCGWGYLLIEAAKKYKIHGTGITLSQEQYKEFNRRIEEGELSDFLSVELMDYRDLPQMGRKFDRVVSVGMVEHVGRENYQLFTDCVDKVLKEGGL